MSLSNPNVLQPYFRLSAIAVVVYDFAMTIPATLRFYRRQRTRSKLVLVCFALCRYTALAYVLVMGSLYFGRDVSDAVCTRAVYVPPILRVLGALGSNGCLYWRTTAVCHSIKRIQWTLGALLLIVTAVDAASIQHLVMVQDPILHNCSSSVFSPKATPKWLFFLVQTIWDGICFVLATYSLVRQGSCGSLREFQRSLLRAGLFYFVVMAMANASNLFLIFSQSANNQVIMIAPTVAATAIMTARLVFGIFERSVPFASSAADVPEATAQKLDRRTSGRQTFQIAIVQETQVYSDGESPDVERASTKAFQNLRVQSAA